MIDFREREIDLTNVFFWIVAFVKKNLSSTFCLKIL